MNGGHNGRGTPDSPRAGVRARGLHGRGLGVEDTEFVAGMTRAFFDTVAEDAELARRERSKHQLIVALTMHVGRAEDMLDVFCRRAENSEHRLDAALAEVLRLRGLLEVECCYEMNGTCRHD